MYTVSGIFQPTDFFKILIEPWPGERNRLPTEIAQLVKALSGYAKVVV